MISLGVGTSQPCYNHRSIYAPHYVGRPGVALSVSTATDPCFDSPTIVSHPRHRSYQVVQTTGNYYSTDTSNKGFLIFLGIALIVAGVALLFLFGSPVAGIIGLTAILAGGVSTVVGIAALES